jgi:hypothetical protein
MKYLLFLIIIISFYFNLFAQDTTRYSIPPTGMEVAQKASSVSMQPTAQALADLFVSTCKGEWDLLLHTQGSSWIGEACGELIGDTDRKI